MGATVIDGSVGDPNFLSDKDSDTVFHIFFFLYWIFVFGTGWDSIGSISPLYCKSTFYFTKRKRERQVLQPMNISIQFKIIYYKEFNKNK
jgi:hypothetical protein